MTRRQGASYRHWACVQSIPVLIFIKGTATACTCRPGRNPQSEAAEITSAELSNQTRQFLLENTSRNSEFRWKFRTYCNRFHYQPDDDDDDDDNNNNNNTSNSNN
jgi:hypothetical protein